MKDFRFPKLKRFDSHGGRDAKKMVVIGSALAYGLTRLYQSLKDGSLQSGDSRKLTYLCPKCYKFTFLTAINREWTRWLVHGENTDAHYIRRYALEHQNHPYFRCPRCASFRGAMGFRARILLWWRRRRPRRAPCPSLPSQGPYR